MSIKLTDLKGQTIEVNFKDIKGHVGGTKDYNIYTLTDGRRIKVKESLAQIRAQNQSTGTTPEETLDTPPTD